ncbi:MAG TPA: ABC transporter ATP-binding protein [Porphyromonadaceae bacterium]|nr:ABC transporter ATP-binding protein [Porphyromonadaceae bacterium]
MSEGEKIVFYFICSVLFAKPMSLIIVDEPEMHLHRSVMDTLWNKLEEERADCIIIYLTNDIPFATSRDNSTALWVKDISVKENRWDYEITKTTSSISQEVYLEILGSRKPMLFIEGNDTSSIDIKLYPHIFPEYIIKPLGGCSKVIESTRAINGLVSGNILQAQGIVDRDRRTEEEIGFLKRHKIYVPQVAEVENLLMLPELIQVVAKRNGNNVREALEYVQKRILSEFEKDFSEQAMLHVRHRVKRQLETNIDKKTTNINEYEHYFRSIINDIHPSNLYADLVNRFRILCRTENYVGILEVYNQKQMLQASNLFKACGVESLNGYIQTIVTALHEGKEDAVLIRTTIKHCLGME